MSIQKLMAAAWSRLLREWTPGDHSARGILQDISWPAVLFTSEKHLRQGTRADWAGVSLDLMRFYSALYRRLRRQGIPVYVHTAYRPPSAQLQLQLEGHSKLSDGPHQRGAALDIVHADLHWQAPREFWDHLGRVGLEVARAQGVKIEWGGDFTSLYDPAHFQLRDWRKLHRVDPNHAPLRCMPLALTRFIGRKSDVAE